MDERLRKLAEHIQTHADYPPVDYEWCGVCGKPRSCHSIACPDCLRLVAETLQSAAQGDAGWKTIETAPKDGTPLLLWVATDDGGEPMILYRNKKGDWLYEGEPTYCTTFYLKPTHWKPLPNPPTQAEE